jgi:hypothetical protein
VWEREALTAKVAHLKEKRAVLQSRPNARNSVVRAVNFACFNLLASLPAFER